MKRLNFPRLFLIIITAVSLVVSFTTLYDNDDPAFDLLCSNDEFLSYQYILSCIVVFSKGKLYEYSNIDVYKKPLISYLATKEKSPPLISSAAIL